MWGFLAYCVLSRAGTGLTPYEDEFIYWADPDDFKYEINAISLASGGYDALWEFYTPNADRGIVWFHMHW